MCLELYGVTAYLTFHFEYLDLREFTRETSISRENVKEREVLITFTRRYSSRASFVAAGIDSRIIVPVFIRAIPSKVQSPKSKFFGFAVEAEQLPRERCSEIASWHLFGEN